MPYQIGYKGERKFKKLSPFPSHSRPFTEAVNATSDVTIERGTTMPALIRKLFNIPVVESFSGKFGFLDRDNKERVYSPGQDDPFVFKNDGSVILFGDHALELIRQLTSMWKQLGLPVELDQARNITIPSTEVVFEALNPSHELHKILVSNYSVICYITSNVDIYKKACVVRNVYPGWWAQSYSGKNAPELDRFVPSLRCLLKAIEIIEKTDKFNDKLREVQLDLGDPLDTNTGYPLFSSEFSAEGKPIAKDKTLEIFNGLGSNYPDFHELVTKIGLRCRSLGLSEYPLMIAPIRRVSYGYKYNHEFAQTSVGLETLDDGRGFNTVRVAWMSPYIYNLYLSPLQARWKTLRKLMPGLFFDGAAKKHRLDVIRKKGKWLAEADYSNYDRFMPINLFTTFYQGYLSRFANSNYWITMCSYLHQGLPLIWPDYIPNASGRGWVFKPVYGLLSGVKVTSEEGTFVNCLVNIQSALEAGVMNEKSMIDYLTMYVRGNSPVGSRDEYFFLQSDDDLLTCDTPDQLYKLGTAFKANSVAAGLKGSLEVGDRFLMRHCHGGRDTPVPARVWQNTLSNEEPYSDPLKFKVGLMMRTDGLLGQKTYDPFDTRKRQDTTRVEVIATLSMLKSLKIFLSSASLKQTDCIQFIELMIEAANYMKSQLSEGLAATTRMSSDHATRIDQARKGAVKELALADLERLSNANLNKMSQAWLYQLHKDKNVPSSAAILDQLTAFSPEFRAQLAKITDMESTYYRHALKTIGINIEMKLK